MVEYRDKMRAIHGAPEGVKVKSEGYKVLLFLSFSILSFLSLFLIYLFI
jgi:hypothetical protein